MESSVEDRYVTAREVIADIDGLLKELFLDDGKSVKFHERIAENTRDDVKEYSESPVNTSEDDEQPTERAEKPTVVVVEDDQFFGQTVVKGLHDFSVELFSSAETTLQYFREARQCDALVLDIMMPAPEGQQEETDYGMSTGLWLLRKIKEAAPKDLPVVIYTNRVVENLGTQLENIGLSPERTKIHTKWDTPPSKLRAIIESLIASEEKQTQDSRTANLPFFNEFAPVGNKRVAQFVGRERELELLINSLRSGETTVVYGDRGIGKTSLAYALQSQLRERGKPSSRPLVCVIHSCAASDSRREFQFDDQLHILLQQLEGTSRVPPLDNRRRLERQFRAYVSRLANEGRSLCVILDDADFLQPESVVEFLSLFRSNDVSSVVMCGTRFGIDLQSKEIPGFDRPIRFVKIGPLTRSEVENLIARGLRSWNTKNSFGIQIEKGATERIAEATTSIPRLVFSFANHIVETLLEDRESMITAEVVERELARWRDRYLQPIFLSALDRVSDRRFALVVLRAIEQKYREVVEVDELKAFGASQLFSCLQELGELSLVDFDSRAQTVRLYDLTKAYIRLQGY